MKLTERKQKIITKLSTACITLTLIAIQANQVFAESIGTEEVQTATDNIKRVITSIAMPLGGVLIFASVVIAAQRVRWLERGSQSPAEIAVFRTN